MHMPAFGWRAGEGEAPVKGPGGGRRASWSPLAAVIAISVATGSLPQAEVRPSAVAIQPLVDPAPAGGAGERPIDPLQDGAPLVARLVLSLTSGITVRWRPVDPGGPGVLSLLPPSVEPAVPEPKGPDPHDPRSSSVAVEGGRRMLESLPRTWRRRSLKRYRALGLATLSSKDAGLLVEALAARAAGDPERFSSLIEQVDPAPELPILTYLRGISRLEAGSIEEAAAALDPERHELGGLPGPLVKVARALVAAAAGKRRRALSLAESAAEGLPSLAEAWALRARLSRSWCDLYDHGRIVGSLDSALASEPCCVSCALDLSQMLALTDRAATAPGRIRADAGCSGGPLDSARDRALALAWASSGAIDEALEAAARAEARDTGALRHGLAPAYLLAQEPARLEQAYDSESDLTLSPEAALEHHFNAGLGALWRGRPSEAARQFERAEEQASRLSGEEADLDPWVQWARTMRVRAYLTAGRIDEARRAADEARAAGRGRLNGLLVFTTALADLAAGDTDAALIWTRRLTPANLKFWRYLLSAEMALAAGKIASAQSALSLAAQGIGAETTVCPGVSVEPYMLHAQARTLLALGRPEEAEHLLMRLIGLGSRGLLAPEILVPSWELVAEARQAQGEQAGAGDAFRELLKRWGAGEKAPATDRARRGLERLESARQTSPPGAGPDPAGSGGAGAGLIYNERASEPAIPNP